jgi:hypothetical protein
MASGKTIDDVGMVDASLLSKDHLVQMAEESLAKVPIGVIGINKKSTH